MINKLFLGAGAMKAGTTWLYGLLQHHPELYFCPEKEIHFWSDFTTPSNYLSQVNRLRKTKEKLGHASNWENIDDYRKLVRWSHNYLQNKITVDWYKRLFILNENPDIYNVDFSNVTCHIPKEGWELVKENTHHLKVIYTIRDPLKRLWSHTKFHHQFSGKEMNFEEWTISEFKEFIEKRFMWLNCQYGTWIENMKSTLNDDEFQLHYFEDFRAAPENKLIEIENFLGIKNMHYHSDIINKKVNPSVSIPMPENFKEAAKPLLEEELNLLVKQGVDLHNSWI